MFLHFCFEYIGSYTVSIGSTIAFGSLHFFWLYYGNAYFKLVAFLFLIISNVFISIYWFGSGGMEGGATIFYIVVVPFQLAITPKQNRVAAVLLNNLNFIGVLTIGYYYPDLINHSCRRSVERCTIMEQLWFRILSNYMDFFVYQQYQQGISFTK